MYFRPRNTEIINFSSVPLTICGSKMHFYRNVLPPCSRFHFVHHSASQRGSGRFFRGFQENVMNAFHKPVTVSDLPFPKNLEMVCSHSVLLRSRKRPTILCHLITGPDTEQRCVLNSKFLASVFELFSSYNIQKWVSLFEVGIRRL